MAKPMKPADLQAIFGLEPQAAIDYLTAKGYAITWNWQEMLDAAHDRAFTVAKAMRLDLLSDIRAALEKALQEGQTLAQFVANLQPVLEAQGWWGKQVLVDSQGDGELVQLGNPRRLKTIYQTNLQSAYMAGRKAAMEETAETHPYWRYVAILDGKTRPGHRALSAAALKRRGLAVQDSTGKLRTETVEIGTDKRTGEIRTAEVTVLRSTDAAGKPVLFRVDPGFNHAPGAGLAAALKHKESEQ